MNSKATLKVPLHSLLPLVPRILHRPLRSSRYFAERSESLVIQSEESRKQAANVESCYEKLHQLLKNTARDAIPGETSQEQRDRVHKLYVYIHRYIGFVSVLQISPKASSSRCTEGRPKTKPESSLRNCTAAKRAIGGVVNLMNDWQRANFYLNHPCAMMNSNRRLCMTAEK